MPSFWLRHLAAKLPYSLQQEARRLQCRWQIFRGRFRSREPEYDDLRKFVKPGDWVLDIGANVGHYSLRLCELVGPSGRVIAVEPVPATFEILAANSLHFAHRNTTLLNVAISDHASITRMDVPSWSYGGPNYYRAHMTETGGVVDVLCCTVDSLEIPHRVALIKIDVEGNARAALRGGTSLIARDRPMLIIEGEPHEFLPSLTDFDYHAWKYRDSPNVLLAANWQGYEGGPELVDAAQLMSRS
jgi:FkbM family methyltransferase